MLVNLVEILQLAEEKKRAVGAFNTPNLECVSAVLNAAERLNVPVHAVTHAVYIHDHESGGLFNQNSTNPFNHCLQRLKIALNHKHLFTAQIYTNLADFVKPNHIFYKKNYIFSQKRGFVFNEV